MCSGRRPARSQTLCEHLTEKVGHAPPKQDLTLDSIRKFHVALQEHQEFDPGGASPSFPAVQLADDSSGIDAVRDILAEFSVPVIFITAFPERLLTGTRPEPTFLITKPFQRATVKAAIAQALFFDVSTVPA